MKTTFHLKAVTLGFVLLVTTSCDKEKISSDPDYSPRFSLWESQTMADFDHAVESGTLSAARRNWEEYIEKHRPNVDDALSMRRLRIAEYELLRVYYLKGDTLEGDRLLKEIVARDSMFSDLID